MPFSCLVSLKVLIARDRKKQKTLLSFSGSSSILPCSKCPALYPVCPVLSRVAAENTMLANDGWLCNVRGALLRSPTPSQPSVRPGQPARLLSGRVVRRRAWFGRCWLGQAACFQFPRMLCH